MGKNDALMESFIDSWGQDPLLPEGVHLVSMRMVSKKLLRGFPSEPVDSCCNGSLCKYISRNCVKNGAVIKDKIKYFKYEIQKKDRSHIVQEKSILFLKYPPNESVLVDKNDIIMVNTDFYIIVPDPVVVNPYYLYAILNNQTVREKIGYDADIYCKDLDAYIKLDKLREVKIPVCSMEKQIEIGEKCKKLLEIIKQNPEAHNDEYVEISHLTDYYSTYMRREVKRIIYKPSWQ